MPRKKRDNAGYTGGAAFSRARKQFQVLYEKEGSFPRAVANMELILWPDLQTEEGKDQRPAPHILHSWAQEVDEGNADIPDKLRKAFLARYDAYTHAAVREALIENAKTAQHLAKLARDGKLKPEFSSQYMHANNGTSFLLKESLGQRPQETPRKIAGMKFLAPKKTVKALKEGTIEGEYRVVK